MKQREELVMRLRAVAILILGFALAACPADESDDDTVGDDDSAAGDDDTTAGDDDTELTWEGEYQVVRICGSDGGDPGSPGPDIDAVLIRRDTDELGYADVVTASQVPSAGNANPDPQAALGVEDDVFVSVGPEGAYLDLTFDFGEYDTPILPGDLVSVFEVDDGSGQAEQYDVLVSYDGSPDTWVITETATGAMAVGVHAPEYFLEGCRE